MEVTKYILQKKAQMYYDPSMTNYSSMYMPQQEQVYEDFVEEIPKNKMLPILLGAGLGAGAGYLGSKYFGDQILGYQPNQQQILYSTLGGGALGGLGGYLV